MKSLEVKVMFFATAPAIAFLSCLLPAGTLFAADITPGAHTDNKDLGGLARKIRPGMTRADVERILPKPAPDEERSTPLYETSRLNVDSYSLDDERDLAIPFFHLKAPAGEPTDAQRGAQKVATPPWVIRNLIVDAGDPDEPYFKIPLPGKTGRKVKRAGEQAQIMTGDIFRCGHEVALAAYSKVVNGKEETFRQFDAVAFYSKRKGVWLLRSFFPRTEGLQADMESGAFLKLAELSGDEVPEVTLTEGQGRNSTYAIFKYDRKTDRLVLAIAEIINPSRTGNSVTSYEHNGAGVFTQSEFAWVGNKLVLKSQANQDHGEPEDWITLAPPPVGGADDGRVNMDYAGRNLETGAVYRWQSFGNMGWLLGSSEPLGDAALWTIVNIGQLRRTIVIKPDTKAIEARGIKPENFDVSQAIFDRPERFGRNSKIKLSDGQTVTMGDIARVEIRDEWPLTLSAESSNLSGDGSRGIPADTVFAGPRSRSLDDATPDFSQWRAAMRHRARGAMPSFPRDTPIALYISGPERGSATEAKIVVKDVRLEEGKVLRVVGDVTGDPPSAGDLKSRPATTIDLGRLEPGEYTVRVELDLAGKGSERRTLETKFRVIR